MGEQWIPLTEAAVRLRLGARTIQRRISRGELQSRLELGRRMVLIDVPEDEEKPPGGDTGGLGRTGPLDGFVGHITSEANQSAMRLASGSINAWQHAAEQAEAERERSEAQCERSDTSRRRLTIAAWSLAAALGVGGAYAARTIATSTEQATAAKQQTLATEGRLQMVVVQLATQREELTHERGRAEAAIEQANTMQQHLTEANAQAEVILAQFDAAKSKLESHQASRATDAPEEPRTGETLSAG